MTQVVRGSAADEDRRLAANRAMERYADGDDSAFDELYELLTPPLFRALLARTRDAERAEDLVQQTMLQLHLTRGRFERGANVFPWVFALARRKLVDDIRWARRKPALEPLREERDDLSTSGVTPAVDEAVDARRALGTLARAIEQLPEDQRVAFALVRQEGLSTREAAARLGITSNALKLRAHRACQALRSALRTCVTRQRSRESSIPPGAPDRGLAGR